MVCTREFEVGKEAKIEICQGLGMVVHTFNPSNGRQKQADLSMIPKASQEYIERSCLKKK